MEIVAHNHVGFKAAQEIDRDEVLGCREAEAVEVDLATATGGHPERECRDVAADEAAIAACAGIVVRPRAAVLRPVHGRASILVRSSGAVVGKAALVLRSRADVRVDLQLAANPASARRKDLVRVPSVDQECLVVRRLTGSRASARLRVSVVDRRAAVFRPTVRVADVRLT